MAYDIASGLSGAGSGAAIGTMLMPGIGTAIGSGAGALMGLGKKKKQQLQLNLPDFYTDPNYSKTQDYLLPFGTNMLEGNIPDYYKDIGMAGGAPFESVMHLVNRDTMNAVNENMTRRNMGRSGLSSVVAGRQMAETGTKLRWEDQQRALEGKKFLMGTGLDTISGVRSAGLNYGNSMNQYNLNKAQLQLGVDQGNISLQQGEDDAWGSILGSLMGTAGNMYGMNQLGKVLGGAGGAGATAATAGSSGMGAYGMFDWGQPSTEVRPDVSWLTNY